MVLRATLFLSALPHVLGLVSPDDVGRLPALGWNSWNAYHCDISEDQFLAAARKLVHLGLADAGYQYVNIDDCWSMKDGRDPQTNKLVPNATRFPDGISGTAHKIHKMGLKIGIYSSAGTETCAGYPASIGFETLDAQTWADWGIDYLKYDNCNVPSNWTDTCNACTADYVDPKYLTSNGTCTSDAPDICPAGYDYSQSNTAERYRLMRDAIKATNRDMLYSLCEWGTAGVEQWGNDTAASWRMSGDISNDWPRVLNIMNQNSFFMNYADFWGHPDADMLEIGNGLTLPQARTHFAVWAAMKSPLLIGTNLDDLDDDNVGILKNPYLLAFNQDSTYGGPASPYKWGTNPDWTYNASFPAEFWAGPSSNGTLVLMFNPFNDTQTKVASWAEIPGLQKGSKYQVVDVWSGESKGCSGDVSIDVKGQDTAALLVQDACYS